jgi:hypothetical protein
MLSRAIKRWRERGEMRREEHYCQNGSNTNALRLTEVGLYQVCLLTRQPVGVALREFLSKEVIPAIQRGRALAPKPDAFMQFVRNQFEQLKQDLGANIHSERLAGDRAAFVAAGRAAELVRESRAPMDGYLVQMLQFLHARGEQHSNAAGERLARLQRELEDLKGLVKDLASRPTFEPRPAQPVAPANYGRPDSITRFCWQAGFGEATKAQVDLINERLIAAGAPGHVDGELWARSVLDNNRELIRRAFQDGALHSVD